MMNGGLCAGSIRCRTYGQMDLVPVGEDGRIDQSGTLGGITGIDSDRDGLDMGGFNPAAERRR